MHHSRYRTSSPMSAGTAWHPRACVRWPGTVRVDDATADGRGWRGLIRNLSRQGMYINSALRHVAHEVAPGNLLTVAFVLPSGQPCKLRGVVIHGDGWGCGVEFLEGRPRALGNLARYWSSLADS